MNHGREFGTAMGLALKGNMCENGSTLLFLQYCDWINTSMGFKLTRVLLCYEYCSVIDSLLSSVLYCKGCCSVEGSKP